MSAQISTMTNSRSYKLRPSISSCGTNYSTNEITNAEAHLNELSAPKHEDGKWPLKQGEAPPSTATAKIHSVQQSKRSRWKPYWELSAQWQHLRYKLKHPYHGRTSAREILISAIDQIKLLPNTRNMHTKIKQIPGHKDITGNELQNWTEKTLPFRNLHTSPSNP